MTSPLRAVHDEHYAIRLEIAERSKRIDGFSVDRSRFANMPLPRWGVEAEALELKHQAYRAELTETDRRRARAEMFKRYTEKRLA